MSKLNELLAQLCPNGVETQKLADVARVERGRRVVREQLSQESGYPVYQNSLTAMGFHTESNYPENTTFVIGAGAAGEIGYSTEAFWAADDCFPIVCSSAILDRYVFHILMWQKSFIASKVRKASIPRLSRDVIENLTIPVPPVEIQSEIVRILDHYEEITIQLRKELEAELIARQKQYEYYRDALLTFADVRGGGTLNVVWRPLGDYFCNIRNGFVGTATPYFTTSDEGVRYLKGTNIHNGMISDNDYCYITPAFHQKHIRNELKADDVLVVQSGHVGECAVVGKKYAGANCHALIIMSNGGQCSSKFVVHYLHSTEGKRKIAAITTGGTVKHILASEMKKFKIPFPPIEEQQRIVALLNRFDSLYNDITLGLPAEIEARQKQYEYYRDKLLTFTEYPA